MYDFTLAQDNDRKYRMKVCRYYVQEPRNQQLPIRLCNRVKFSNKIEADEKGNSEKNQIRGMIYNTRRAGYNVKLRNTNIKTD